MRAGIYRSVSMLLTALFLLSSLLTGTLGWQSLSQNANNELREHEERLTEVLLLKLEKQPDGTKTEIPVPGAAFYLFTEDGTQLGGRYVTDENGTISVSLKPGEYYFEESAPAPGFTFDIDETGQRVTRYPFTITGEETETVIVTAYNIRLQGALSVQKLVENADGSPLTDEQEQQEFVFTVTFSDGGAYEYTVDGGEPQEIASGGTLTLKPVSYTHLFKRCGDNLAKWSHDCHHAFSFRNIDTYCVHKICHSLRIIAMVKTSFTHCLFNLLWCDTNAPMTIQPA